MRTKVRAKHLLSSHVAASHSQAAIRMDGFKKNNGSIAVSYVTEFDKEMPRGLVKRGHETSGTVAAP
jgi:hypothetical protein